MANLNLGIVIGAALSSSFRSTFSGAEKSTDQLGKALRDTDAKLRTVTGIKRFEGELSRLRAEQASAGGNSKALANEIRGVERELSRAQKTAGKYGIALDRLGDEEARLTREQAKNKRRDMGAKVGRSVGGGLATAGRVAGAGVGVAVAVAGAAFAMGKEFADNAEALVNTANKLGYTTQAYQELQLAAAAAGISQETFNDSSEKMVTEISRVAATGKGAAAPALAELGLSAKKLGQMKPDEQMQAISDAMGKVANADDKLRLTKGIFGKGGGEMVTVLGGNLSQMREEVRKTGAVLSDKQLADGLKLDDALDRAELSAKGLTNTVGAALVPALTSMVEKASAFATDHGPQLQAMGTVLGATFTAVGEILGGAFNMLEKIGTSIGETLGWIEEKSGVITKIANLFGGDDSAGGAQKPAPADVFPATSVGATFAEKNGAAAGPVTSVGATFAEKNGAAAGPALPRPTLSGGGNNTTTNSVHAPITINAAPGQSPEAIGQQVDKHLRAREKQAGIQQRGALHDGASTQ